MQTQVRKLVGSWEEGYALHKHTVSSVHTGTNAYGHPTFDTTRSEPGEALYQLKYRGDWSMVQPLAAQVSETLIPLLGKVDLIVPMPASTARTRQPVHELARALGRLINAPVFDELIKKASPPAGTPSLKNLHSRSEKKEALAGLFTLNECISNEGHWNALLLDDLYDTGATMDAVCEVLRTYGKINRIYAAVITWK